MKELTDKQKNVLIYIVLYVKKNLFSPSFREIASYIGTESTNCVSDYIKALEKKGWVELSKSKARNILLTKKTRQRYGLMFASSEASLSIGVMNSVIKFIDGYPDNIDLSTSTGAEQGADTVVRILKKIIEDEIGV